MTTPTETAFLRELDKKLWDSANRLRNNLDAAVYKHAVLGLVFDSTRRKPARLLCPPRKPSAMLKKSACMSSRVDKLVNVAEAAFRLIDARRVN